MLTMLYVLTHAMPVVNFIPSRAEPPDGSSEASRIWSSVISKKDKSGFGSTMVKIKNNKHYVKESSHHEKHS